MGFICSYILRLNHKKSDLSIVQRLQRFYSLDYAEREREREREREARSAVCGGRCVNGEMLFYQDKHCPSV